MAGVRVLLLGAVLAGLALPAAAEAPDQSAYAWLERMNRAVRTLNYEGRFVYLNDNRIKSLYIAHTQKDGREREQLLSLNGPVREVLRDHETVTCIRPGRDPKTTQVQRRPVVRSFSPLLAARPAQLESHYRLVLGKEARVAGRTARRVHIQPKDDLRYGYRLYLDEEYALPLRTLLLDDQGTPLSQILFTELHVSDQVKISPLPNDGADPSADGPQEREPQRVNLVPPGWEFRAPPTGFQLDVHRRRPDADIEHFIFSDGLATISVYVEPVGAKTLSGLSHMGTVNALSRVNDGYQFTAIGEVPPRTLTLLLDGVRRRP